uniref:C-type lectin domain-containing protein n=1 Tax=Poecilia mexicana TaxID=48701 RepID=A0A3B3YQT0_9TELE
SKLYEFLYINENKTWTEAQQYCREKHTDLVTVTNMKDMKRLTSKSPGTMTEAWIGLRDPTNAQRTWHWSQPGVEFDVNKTEWNHDEPNDNDIENCGFILDSLKWGDISCNRQKYFLCYNDKLILINKNKTWEDALYHCRDHYHDLVTITNMDDQMWVQEKVRKATSPLVWMGLRYTCTLDFWFWVSDEVVRYKNWAKGEPMDDCDMSGAMETGRPYQWFKTFDHMRFNFVCYVS